MAVTTQPHPEPQCFLWRLPQELQDMIFKHAYPRQANLTIHFSSAWEQGEEFERKRDRAKYVTRPFPRHKVTDFMVSKRFFVQAAQAWVSAQSWAERVPFRDDQVFDFLRQRVSLFLEYAHEITFDYSRYLAEKALAMSRLRHLTVVVNDQDLDGVDGKDAWEDNFTRHELESLRIVASLSKIRGLRDFTIVLGHCIFANTDAKRNILKANIAALEDIIKPIVMGAKDVSRALVTRSHTSTPQCLPVYPKSKVCFTCSNLHQVKGVRNVLAEASGYEEGTNCKNELRKSKLRCQDIPSSRAGIQELVRTQSEDVVDYLFRMQQQAQPEQVFERPDCRMRKGE